MRDGREDPAKDLSKPADRKGARPKRSGVSYSPTSTKSASMRT